MKRLTVAFGLLSATLGLPAVADVDPLTLIPADSGVVIRIKAPETTVSALAEFVNQVQPGIGPLIQGQGPVMLGAAIQNPTLAGVDQKRDIYFVLNAVDGQPQGFMLVPVTDAAELRENTGAGQGYQFVESDGWIASSVHSLEAVKACVSGEAKSIKESLLKDALELLNKGHLGVALQGAPLRAGMTAELEQAKSDYDQFLGMMSTQFSIAAQGGEGLDGMIDVYRILGDCAFQVIEDATSAGVSLTVSNEALRVEKSLSVSPGSKTADLLVLNAPGSAAKITEIPEGMQMYFAVNGNSDQLLEFSQQFASSFYKGESGDKIKRSMKHIKDAGIESYAAGMGLVSDGNGLLRFAGKAQMKNGAAVRKSLKIFGDGFEFDFGYLKQKVTYKHDAETIGEDKVTIQHLAQEIPDELDPSGIQEKMNTALYGPEGFTQRIIVRDKEMLQTMGGGTAAMETFAEGKAHSDEDLKDTLKQLGGNSNLTVVADLPNGLRGLGKMVLAAAPTPTPVTLEQLDNLEIAPSWAGFSVSTAKNRVTATAHIPVESIQGIARLVMFVQPQVQ